MPVAPVQAQQPAVNVVQGTLAQRKLKVKNIDPRVVTNSDLQKLFSKCGPLVRSSFDANEFGQYLGTATVIYAKASSATRAVKEYNLAQIDNRTMRVQFPMQPAADSPVKQAATPVAAKKPAAKQAVGVRKTAGRIGKSGKGRTLNVSGAARRGRS